MRVSFSVVAGVVLAITTGVSAQPQYEITDLGGAGELGTTHAYAINEQGQIAGQISPLFGGSTPFLWRNGEMLDLGTLEGASYAQANAVNDSGTVVGATDSRAFLWNNGVMIDLGLLPGGNQAFAFDINNSGQVTGYSGDNVEGDPPWRAFIWQDGVMTDLGEPEGYWFTLASGINDLGQVIGRMNFIGSADHHAFLYTAGDWTDLGALDDDALSEAKDINNNAQVVGWSQEEVGAPIRAFLWQDGEMVGLNVPRGFEYGYPLAINNNGTVVGYGDRESGADSLRAVAWFEGTMYDLNDLLVPDSPWDVIEFADDINDAGQIVGKGRNADGDTNAFLLTPIIETPCPGDANGDGVVNPLDSGFVLARFGCSVGTGDPDCDTADQNADGSVDPLDAGFVLSRFGPCD